MRIETIRHLRLFAAVIVISVLLALGGCSGEKHEEGAADTGEAAGKGENNQAESMWRDIVLHRLDGETVSMAAYEGKLVVLFFWASWNSDSRELIEIMNELYPRHSRRYEFLAVSMDEGGVPAIRSFLLEHPITCDVFVNGAEVARAFNGVARLPTVLFFLRDGRVIRRVEGLHRRKQYEELLAGIKRYQP